MRAELIGLVNEPLLESHVIVLVHVLHHLLVLARVRQELVVFLVMRLFLFDHYPPVFFLAQALPEDVGTAEASCTSDQVDGCRTCEIVETSLLEPAASPVPSSYHGVDEGGQKEGEHHIRVQLSPLSK